jgi:hypothetical protein
MLIKEKNSTHVAATSPVVTALRRKRKGRKRLGAFRSCWQKQLATLA